MCTVIYLPGATGPCFASLRDENPLRPRASAPVLQAQHGMKVLAPLDGLAGGTWIGVNEKGTVLVLLNGAFERHERKAAYAQSRGIVVMRLLTAGDALDAWKSLDLYDIEPFTLVVWQQSQLHELVWDGRQAYNRQPDASIPWIWSSATLYEAGARAQRRRWFEQWMPSRPEVMNEATMLDFFQSVHDEENGFIMHRPASVQTLSYSFIKPVSADAMEFYYQDFALASKGKYTIELTEPALPAAAIL